MVFSNPEDVIEGFDIEDSGEAVELLSVIAHKIFFSDNNVVIDRAVFLYFTPNVSNAIILRFIEPPYDDSYFYVTDGDADEFLERYRMAAQEYLDKIQEIRKKVIRWIIK